MVQKNEMMKLAGKWMELETITISEVKQAQEHRPHMLSLMCGW